jgi:multiple sugar transport system permease protein
MAIERVGSRVIKFYVPLTAYLVFLLFPFYWMVNTVFKSDIELYNLELNPLYVHSPTLGNIVSLFTETIFLRWMANTFFVAITATVISLVASLLAAYAIQRLQFKTSGPTGVAIFLGYLVPQTILFIPLAHIIFKVRLWDSLWSLVLTYLDYSKRQIRKPHESHLKDQSQGGFNLLGQRTHAACRIIH